MRKPEPEPVCVCVGVCVNPTCIPTSLPNVANIIKPNS